MTVRQRQEHRARVKAKRLEAKAEMIRKHPNVIAKARIVVEKLPAVSLKDATEAVTNYIMKHGQMP